MPKTDDWEQRGRLGRRGRVRRRARAWAPWPQELRAGGQARGRRHALHRPPGGRPRLRPAGAEGGRRHDHPAARTSPRSTTRSPSCEANPNRYVIKPSGEAQNIKRLLFVGEEEDGRDVVAGAGGLQARLVGQDQGVPAPAAHHGRRGRGRRVLQRQGVRHARSASTSSTRSCSPATSARRPARWAPRCSGASPTRSSTPR